jgi:hypothetical protein
MISHKKDILFSFNLVCHSIYIFLINLLNYSTITNYGPISSRTNIFEKFSDRIFKNLLYFSEKVLFFFIFSAIF